jgi:hypothetical protein
MAAKSFMFFRKTVVLTTPPMLAPAASRTVFRFASDAFVCAATPSGKEPVSVLTGSCPETKTRFSKAMPGDRGTPGAVRDGGAITVRDMSFLS